MKSYVVIGAGYGDEGKGLMTDYLTRLTGSQLVVRFNGGAQAGHTVVDGDKRHVFHHIGSGALAGAETFLSSKFIVNPFILHEEMEALKKLGVPKPTVYIDPEARMSTVYDSIINQLVERHRGSQRHGSCGVGINETVTRHEHIPVYPSMPLATLIKVHEKIRNEWFMKRCTELGLHEFESVRDIIDDISPEQHATMAYNWIAEHAQLFKPIHLKSANEPVIFEGAQGLMLDEYLGTFPHVTRSMTGLPNAILAAKELGQERITPVYVTRAYATRHGAGVMGSDLSPQVTFKLQDQTNVDNEWQGSIKAGALYVPHLLKFIGEDLARGRAIGDLLGVKIDDPLLAVTCLDQLNPTELMYIVAPNYDTVSINRLLPKWLPNELARVLGMKLGFVSTGPTARDVTECYTVVE